MPVHGHHGRQPPVATVGSTPDMVELDGIDFSMRGPWQVSFNVQPAGGTSVLTTFQVCVE